MHILQEFFIDHAEEASSIEYVCPSDNHISSLWGTHHNVCDKSIKIPSCSLFVIPWFDLSLNIVGNKRIIELSIELYVMIIA